MELKNNDRNKILLMLPTKKVRDQINNKLILALNKEKTLKGKLERFKALRQKYFLPADHNFALSYKK